MAADIKFNNLKFRPRQSQTFCFILRVLFMLEKYSEVCPWHVFGSKNRLLGRNFTEFTINKVVNFRSKVSSVPFHAISLLFWPSHCTYPMTMGHCAHITLIPHPWLDLYLPSLSMPAANVSTSAVSDHIFHVVYTFFL